MARYDFRLPDIGEGTATAQCVAWHVAIGDTIAEDAPLLDVMTDKATVEVTSPVAGTIVERIGDVGEELAVGGVVLVFELTTDGDAPDPAPAAIPAPVITTPMQVSKRIVPTTPAVRERARELGVDLNDVYGSGPHGRVRQGDLERHIATAVKAPPAALPAASISTVVPFSAEQDIETVAITGLRQRIGERLQDTKRRIPHFSYIEEVDVTALEALRLAMNAGEESNRPRLTLLPLLMQALVRALPGFPQINARYDDAAGVLHRHRKVDIGIATQTPAGLVVTVARDAGSRDVWGNAIELGRLTAAARAGRATPRDLSGSTITITSLGAIGGLATTPVINSPEVAILGVNKMVDRPVVRGGRIEVARMMNLSASFDHRIVDGWDAASFIQRVRQLLETPALLFAPD